MKRAWLYLLLVLVQAGCAGVFLLDILMSIFGFYPVPLAWTTRELMEMGAGFGLLLGLVFGTLLLWRGINDLHQTQALLDRASSAFMDMLNTRFDEWRLTAAERDVAMFAIKGLNVQEIAALRETSEGTVKAQTAAIYRKAGVSGRPQLLSLFIDDMMGGPPNAAEQTGESKAALRV